MIKGGLSHGDGGQRTTTSVIKSTMNMLGLIFVLLMLIPLM